MNARGAVVFRRTETGQTFVAEVPETGRATYSATLFSGAYTALFVSYHDAPSVPRQDVKLDDIDLQDTTTRSFDLRTAAVSGEISIDGREMPGDANSRGVVVFRRLDTGNTWSAAVPDTGRATYAADLFTGTYLATFVSYHDAPEVPPQEVKLDLFDLQTSLTRSFDLATVTVSGALTVDGREMPDDENFRGEVLFRRLDTGDTLAAGVPDTGSAVYRSTLFSGSYTIDFASHHDAGTVPVQTVNLGRGCVSAADCSGSPEDLSGRWSSNFPNWLYDTMLLDLTQVGSEITGSFDFVGLDAGEVTGRIDGDGTVSITGWGSYCETTLEGTMFGGCFISGRATCNSQTSEWLAVRLE